MPLYEANILFFSFYRQTASVIDSLYEAISRASAAKEEDEEEDAAPPPTEAEAVLSEKTSSEGDGPPDIVMGFMQESWFAKVFPNIRISDVSTVTTMKISFDIFTMYTLMIHVFY